MAKTVIVQYVKDGFIFYAMINLLKIFYIGTGMLIFNAFFNCLLCSGVVFIMIVICALIHPLENTIVTSTFSAFVGTGLWGAFVYAGPLFLKENADLFLKETKEPFIYNKNVFFWSAFGKKYLFWEWQKVMSFVHKYY